jgi:biotin carboxyl carrier protein
MKMKTSLNAPVAGVVKKINVAAGDWRRGTCS